LVFLGCLHHVFGQFVFSDASNRLGTQAVHSGAAMGIADMNNDGLDDIVRLDQGQFLYISYQASNGNFSNYNVGNLQGVQWSLCIADVDDNNFNDIFTGGSYNNLKLIRANNQGSLYTVSTVAANPIFLQGSNFADIDNDGLVDIFAAHDDGLSLPLKNLGNGLFTTDFNLIMPSSTVPSDNSGNYGTVWTDYNNDGKLDLYISKCRAGVTNPLDGRRLNLLFRNNGNGTFTEVAEAAGLRPLAQSWAADFADIDNDGDLDCFIITHDSPSRLYRNNGQGQFTEITPASGLLTALNGTGPGLQVKFEDFNNDGFVDLLYTTISGTHLLFRNNGNSTFSAVTGAFPTGGNRIHSATTGDLDNNGYMDVYASFGSGYNTPGTVADRLFLNQLSGNNYLKVRLRGETSNINGIGARIEIYGQWGVQVREVRSGESYGITSTLTRHFGIGTASLIDSLIVRWPSGVVDRFLQPGINTTRVVTEGSGCLLVADFSHTTNAGSVAFTDQSTLGASQWSWSFGDGNSSSLQNPTHTYAQPGTYTVCLTATGTCGTANRCKTITVSCAAPTAGFSLQVSGLTVSLSNQSTGGATFWNWSFGNGNTSGLPNPSVTYTQPGTYTICLTAGSNCGTSLPFCQQVTLSCAAPVSGFTTQSNGLSINLIDQSTGGATAWSWSFGNGSTASTQNPSFTYPQPGTYTVCLIASSACGVGQEFCQNVTVSCAPPTAGFSGQSNGLTLQLSDQSTGGVTAWSWSFGNGGTSTQQNPSVTYSQPGTYTVCLTSFSVCGASIPFCQQIAVNCAVPTGNFSTQINGLTVNLLDMSTGGPTQWSWIFGNGSTSIQQNPSVTYAQPGTYTICLVASSICGDATIVCRNVTVNCAAPVANFDAQTNGLSVTLTDQSVGGATQWSWSFGNGNTSTTQNPSVTFTQPGTYTICLTASSQCGPGMPYCQQITVSCAPPVAAFTAQVNGLSVTLNDQSSGGPALWSWTFGNNTSSTNPNPTVTYTQPGTYNICLVVSSICGIGNSFCQQVSVTCAAPASQFSFQTNGLTVSLSDLSTGAPTAWSWNFGNGATSTQQNPVVTYQQPGDYIICLRASSICGMGAQTCIEVTVNCTAPVSAFSTVVNDLQVSFTDQTSGAPGSWSWDFGDGSTSTQQNPNHSYSAPGAYQVCLTTTSICGTNTVCIPVTVSCTRPEAAFSISFLGSLLLFSDASMNNPTQWHWSFGNGATSTEQNPIYIYTQNGNYQVCLIASNVCGADTICQTAVVGTVSIREPELEGVFSASPNPVSDNLSISLVGINQHEAVLWLSDALGRRVRHWTWQLSGTVTPQQQTVSVADLPPGIYWLVLQTRAGIRSLKIIKT
jgi:PKD repeat protein